MPKYAKRLLWLTAFVVLLGIEVLIALFVHDDFVRPYIGDVLVVCVIYCLCRVAVPEKLKSLPLWVTAFAVLVEVLQYFDIVGRLGLENNRVLAIALGSTFDPLDILCYIAGGVLLMLTQLLIFYKKPRNSRTSA